MSNKKNQLPILDPKLLREWDLSKNGGIPLSNISKGIHKSFFWVCPKNHSYESTIYNRLRGRGCSICTGKKVLIGFNDIQALFPHLAEEWDSERNGNLTPQMFTKGSHKKVSWICPVCKESYEAAISDRTKKKPTGCPYCNKGVPRVGKTDLATLRPDLAKQWDIEKNESLTPQMFSIGSKEKVYWKCQNPDCVYSWPATIFSRTKLNSGCPACSGRIVYRGKNDLETMRPDLLQEWDFEKNKGIDPKIIAFSSHKKVYWICEKRHSFQASVVNRTSKGATACPYCQHRKVLAGFNDFKTIFPEKAALWNYERNKAATPESITAYSSKKAWFKCKAGHEFHPTIYDYACSVSLCPKCKKEYK